MFRKQKSRPVDFGFQQHPLSEKPLLIVSGMGRSGTTLLRNCVAAHSSILCRNYESNYIHDLMGAADHNHEIPSRIPGLPVSSEEYWQLHRQFILHLLWPLNHGDFRSDAEVIATYSMLNPRTAAGLARTFSDLRIFYIIRNGIEVVSSYQVFEPFREMSFLHVCKLWALRRNMIRWGAGRPEFCLFRYESLLQPELFRGAFAEALERCGLEFEPACLEPLDQRYHPTKFPGESAQDARDLSMRDQRWRHWTDEQQSIFVDQCQHLMGELGYPIPWLDAE